MPDEREPDSQEDGQKEAESLAARLKIAAEASKAKLAEGALTDPLPDLDPDLEERVRSLQERAGAARREHEARKQTEQRRLDADREGYRGLSIGLSVAYAILVPPILGWLVGWLIARQTGSTAWIALVAFVGIVVGVTAALLMLQRYQK